MSSQILYKTGSSTDTVVMTKNLEGARGPQEIAWVQTS